MVANHVLRKEQIEGPFEGDPKFFLDSREFDEIEGSPQPPGDESGKIDPEDIPNSASPADRRQLSEGRESKRLFCCPLNGGAKVVSDPLSLTHSMLRGRRMWLPRLMVQEMRAVADREHAG